MERESAVRRALSETIEPLRKALPTPFDHRTPQEVIAQAVQALQLNLGLAVPVGTARARGDGEG
jgi:hypothetical protein